jgi:hypothetical protein
MNKIDQLKTIDQLRKVKMRINTMIDLEETKLRLQLAKADELIRLQLLACFRPNASLRQMENQRKLNFR